MKVPFVNLGLQNRLIKDELLSIVSGLLDSGQFILGEDLAKFEKSFAHLCGTTYAVGVANGTDALFLSMKVLGIGRIICVKFAPKLIRPTIIKERFPA